MKKYRRYEILLPRRFNDGRRVPAALLRQTFRELEARFSAVSAERQTILGSWRQGEKSYHDELVRMFVDVPADPENESFPCFLFFGGAASPLPCQPPNERSTTLCDWERPPRRAAEKQKE